MINSQSVKNLIAQDEDYLFHYQYRFASNFHLISNTYDLLDKYIYVFDWIKLIIK